MKEMKDLIYFKRLSCPYCKAADVYLAELMKENPDYGKIKITVIDEQQDSETAERYDYYYVPCFFMENEKLHEGASTREKIKAVLDTVMQS